MDGPREYYAKWNKSVRKSWEPHDFTNMWDTKLKLKDTHKQQHGGYQREGDWEVVGSGMGLNYGDRRWFDYGWRAHSASYWSYIRNVHMKLTGSY